MENGLLTESAWPDLVVARINHNSGTPKKSTDTSRTTPRIPRMLQPVRLALSEVPVRCSTVDTNYSLSKRPPRATKIAERERATNSSSSEIAEAPWKSFCLKAYWYASWLRE